MNITLGFIRSFFSILCIFFMTFFMISKPEGATLTGVISGVGIGAVIAAVLICFDILFRRYNLRSFNVVIIGLFIGYLMGEALVLVFSALLSLTSLTQTLPKDVIEVIRIALFLFGTYLGAIMTMRASDELYVSVPFVKFTSKGPIIFKQDRYGLDGRKIKVWKFRSMTVTENSNVVTQAKKNDARITPLGGFLRRTSLDELPQFINVLKGDMSIVGPRPHAVAHNEEYRKKVEFYMLRHKAKPGITGWAQINGWRGETDTLDKMEKRVEFDLHYIKHWSLWFDVKIIFMTIFKGFKNANAY